MSEKHFFFSELKNVRKNDHRNYQTAGDVNAEPDTGEWFSHALILFPWGTVARLQKAHTTIPKSSRAPCTFRRVHLQREKMISTSYKLEDYGPKELASIFAKDNLSL